VKSRRALFALPIQAGVFGIRGLEKQTGASRAGGLYFPACQTF
jgi:hypothetical protein